VSQHEHLDVIDTAKGNSEKIANPDVDRHPHALDGATQHNALAMKLDSSHAAIGAYVVRIEADWQRKRVEPQCAARPGGNYTA